MYGLLAIYIHKLIYVYFAERGRLLYIAQRCIGCVQTIILNDNGFNLFFFLRKKLNDDVNALFMVTSAKEVFFCSSEEDISNDVMYTDVVCVCVCVFRLFSIMLQMRQ